MGKIRLEAFSDSGSAIIITIMVLELKVPYGAGFRALALLWPVFMSKFSYRSHSSTAACPYIDCRTFHVHSMACNHALGKLI